MADIRQLVRECESDSQKWFPDVAQDLPFMALALGGESGELQNLVKKVARGSMTIEEARAEIAEEAMDVLIYLCNIFAILKVDPMKLYAIKRSKNNQRFGNGRKNA